MSKSFESCRNDAYYNYNWRSNSSNDSGSNQNETTKLENDSFIPLESSSPMNFKRGPCGPEKWQRNRGFDGYSNNRNRQNNYHRQSGSPNNSYKGNRSFQGNRTSPNNFYNRNPRFNQNKEPFKVAAYFNPKAIFENPWEDLLKIHLMTSKQSNKSIDDSLISQNTASNTVSLYTTHLSCSQEVVSNISAEELVSNTSTPEISTKAEEKIQTE